MPLTAGFFAKLYIFTAAADAGLWWLLVVGVVNTGMSAFYYLRVVYAIYARPDTTVEPSQPGKAATALVSLGVCTAVMILFGLYPAPLIGLAESASRVLGF